MAITGVYLRQFFSSAFKLNIRFVKRARGLRVGEIFKINELQAKMHLMYEMSASDVRVFLGQSASDVRVSWGSGNLCYGLATDLKSMGCRLICI